MALCHLHKLFTADQSCGTIKTINSQCYKGYLFQNRHYNLEEYLHNHLKLHKFSAASDITSRWVQPDGFATSTPYTLLITLYKSKDKRIYTYSTKHKGWYWSPDYTGTRVHSSHPTHGNSFYWRHKAWLAPLDRKGKKLLKTFNWTNWPFN